MQYSIPPPTLNSINRQPISGSRSNAHAFLRPDGHLPTVHWHGGGIHRLPVRLLLRRTPQQQPLAAYTAAAESFGEGFGGRGSEQASQGVRQRSDGRNRLSGVSRRDQR